MKEKSPLALLLASRFPGKKFTSADLKVAGRKLSSLGEEGAASFLSGRQRDFIPNLRPPAFCRIVAVSRPISEWPISRVSRAVQEYVFSMTEPEFRKKCGGLPAFPSRKEDLLAWVRESGIEESVYDGVHVQALNLIIRSAAATYAGVLKKVENRNKKAAERLERKNESRRERGLRPIDPPAPASAFKEDGKLLHPPGANPNILCYQGVKSRPVLDPSRLPGAFRLYRRIPKDSVGDGRTGDRLQIPEGEPGHVPQWQRREGLVKEERGRRIRKWYNRANLREHGRPPTRPRDPERLAMAEVVRAEESILMETKIGEDWAVYDVRGLLRNARWRGVPVEADGPVSGLMGLFSGDPVIDPVRMSITFIYREGVVDANSRDVVPARFAPKALKRELAEGPAALVSCDLGQTNLLAARASRVSLLAGEVVVDGPSSVVSMPDEVVLPVLGIREAMDRLEEELLVAAKASLPGPLREEVLLVDSDTPEEAASRLCERMGLDRGSLPWEKMGPGTSYVPDLLRSLGRADEAVFEGRELKDAHFARGSKLRLSPGTRKALNEALFDAKKSSPRYGELSRRKKEAVRRAVNHLVRSARAAHSVRKVVLNIEDLNVSSGFFSGRGKRQEGWSGLLGRKRENRWLITAFHGAICDLAKNRGYLVVESPPQRTSMTCPECGHCEAANRSGERFSCLRCGHLANADFDVATRNLEKVALSGKAMPRPREGLGDEAAAGTARRAGARSRARSGDGPARSVRSTGETKRNRSQSVDQKAS